jgi:dephospho-CoA kinase
MAAQATDEERRAVATWVVDNAGDLSDLERQVDGIWPELVERAEAAAPATTETPDT